MQPPSNVGHFFPFISTNWLVSANFEDMRFLGPHSASEGPQFTKIGAISDHHFEKVGPHGTVAMGTKIFQNRDQTFE